MADEFDVLRWSTIHPAVVHFTLGTLPLMVLAYAVAAWRRSERWTFVADVTAAVTAVTALLSVAFGLVANFLLTWPGGIELWRWLHLGFGVASAVLLLGFAAARLTRRGTAPVSGYLASIASAGIAAVVLFTGWLGGEVLVFHSGMAVKAAGQGALSPPIRTSTAKPRDLHQAMKELRPSWGAAVARVSRAVIEQPDERDFRQIAEAAAQMQSIAGWIREHDGDHPSGVRFMAGRLHDRAKDLEEAAEKQELPGVASALGEVTKVCAGCHQSYRWDGEPEKADKPGKQATRAR